MARSYARIMTAIWRNREFRALPSEPQRVFLLLVSQPDITAVGVLPLTIRRWADMSADSTPAIFERALRVLEERRFIVVDWDTEELLVRSFVKWDAGYNNRKRKPVIEAAAGEVGSLLVLRALAVEFDRVGLPLPSAHTPPDTPPDRPSGSPSDPDHAPGSDGDATESVQEDALTGGTSASDRVVVTEVVSSHNPQSATNNPPPAGAQPIVAAWIDTCRKRPPGNVIAQVGKHVKAMLEEGIDGEDVHAGVLEWARKGLHPATLPSVVNEVMNRPADRGHVNQTDANIQAFLSQGQPALYALPGGETA